MEDIFVIDGRERNKSHLLVIYDISNDRKRAKCCKYISGFGIRVQNSAYEIHTTKKVVSKFMKGIKAFAGNGDSIRIYDLQRNSLCYSSGGVQVEYDDVIVM